MVTGSATHSRGGPGGQRQRSRPGSGGLPGRPGAPGRGSPAPRGRGTGPGTSPGHDRGRRGGPLTELKIKFCDALSHHEVCPTIFKASNLDLLVHHEESSETKPFNPLTILSYFNIGIPMPATTLKIYMKTMTKNPPVRK